MIKSDGTACNIAASSAQAELRFRDPRNPDVDILFLETSTSPDGYPWFYHGGIGGPIPQQVYMYPRFPEGKDIPGKFVKCDAIKPSAGDKLGYSNDLKSPYEEPTDVIEYIITPGQHLGAEYYNYDDERAHQPVMNLLFVLYLFEALTKEKHPTLISAIAARSIPAAFFTAGFGDAPLDLGSTLKKDWGVEPMSLDDALALRARMVAPEVRR